MFELYLGLYDCKNPKLNAFASKIGHSLDGIIRAKGLLFPVQLQDVFWINGFTRDQVIKLEKQFNEVMSGISQSGGSGEAHLFAECQWREVQKVIREVILPISEKINWHPNAGAFEPRELKQTAFLDISQDFIKSQNEMKKDYFSACVKR
jgi:hypothetical protein|tara:strand:+ start:110 stop:559 length:450 start_codon:yes stop_codon:yes gene_type:complete